MDELENNLRKKMQDAYDVFEKNLQGFRTGRASPELLEPVEVDAYGQKMRLNQLASVSVQGPLLLSVQIWDAGLAPSVEKAIRDSGLGLNPQSAGTVLRVPLPELTTERRKDLTKKLISYGEEARITVRSIRKQGMDDLRAKEKAKEISEDELHRYEKSVQTLIDKGIDRINAALAAKEKDLLKI